MTLTNLALAIFAVIGARGQSLPVPLTSVQPHKVKVEQVTDKGKQAIRITDAMELKPEDNEDRVVVLMTNSAFLKVSQFGGYGR